MTTTAQNLQLSAIPSAVPLRRLSNGTTIPGIGLGTFGSDKVSGETVAGIVAGAVRGGYRLVDCASCYGNEAQIGHALAQVWGSEIQRQDLFVISKVWNNAHQPRQVAESARRTLADLQLDYLDAYLVHWPFPNHHAPGAAPEARNPDARPYLHDEFMETWDAMEKLVTEGLVRGIGSSNMTIPKLELLLRDATILPVLNEMELHPTFQQGRLFQYCLDHQIQPVGYSPIGSPSRPQRDQAQGDHIDIEIPEIQAVAAAHGVHPAIVCLKWACQRGQIPIPFSTNLSRCLDNLRSVTTDPLTPREMELIQSVERNSRLIKGQVFLWPGSTDWMDLWDIDGTIPGWEGYQC
jgi:diketogulonate reductase-like aldo/keto reductase